VDHPSGILHRDAAHGVVTKTAATGAPDIGLAFAKDTSASIKNAKKVYE